MVMSVSSLTGNGLKDWLIQRVSAVYLLGYVIWLLTYFGCHMPFQYDSWSALFHNPCVRVGTVLAFFMLVLHAWIGIWTVTTDYIKCTIIRVTVQILLALFLGAQLIWSIAMVWGQ
ncbi:MAG: succinate dehydrogenase, hydrophobic membrane anchor protein [Gammaproteobacteria bacterium]|nr:succinate dehydrogenase, hydrophobic membrane anchor protein [Gammaproteobacteria bacterium]